MADNITIKYYRKRCQAFNKQIDSFCNKAGITSNLNNALSYRASQGIGKFWGELYLAPKLYLANSRTFLNYRLTLDNDFANDVMNIDEIFKFQQEAVKDLQLHIELKNIMKNDYINSGKI